MKTTLSNVLDRVAVDNKMFCSTIFKVYGHEMDDFYSLTVSPNGSDVTIDSAFITYYDATGNRSQEPFLTEKIEGKWDVDEDVREITLLSTDGNF